MENILTGMINYHCPSLFTVTVHDLDAFREATEVKRVCKQGPDLALHRRPCGLAASFNLRAPDWMRPSLYLVRVCGRKHARRDFVQLGSLHFWRPRLLIKVVSKYLGRSLLFQHESH